MSYLKGILYVTSFALNKYGGFLSENRLPIIKWKTLSMKEQVRYYFLTKLFGMTLATKKFYQKFNVDIHKKLRKELLFFKFFGLARENNSRINVTQKGIYLVNVMMRDFYASLNGFRKYCIEPQI